MGDIESKMVAIVKYINISIMSYGYPFLFGLLFVSRAAKLILIGEF